MREQLVPWTTDTHNLRRPYDAHGERPLTASLDKRSEKLTVKEGTNVMNKDATL